MQPEVFGDIARTRTRGWGTDDVKPRYRKRSHRS